LVTYAIPVLPARNMGETLDFWREQLHWDEIHRDDDYGIVERDKQQVHFFNAPKLDPWTNDGGCRLGVEDVDSFHTEYEHHVFAPIRAEPWGTREFAVLDPNRNLIWLVGHE
jgi:catechol 2,3-dioxygenase-like lactoylglutathione lyase family enzyme